jgi:hypothetical protein
MGQTPQEVGIRRYDVSHNLAAQLLRFPLDINKGFPPMMLMCELSEAAAKTSTRAIENKIPRRYRVLIGMRNF